MSHGKISKEIKTQTERNPELCKLVERKPPEIERLLGELGRGKGPEKQKIGRPK